MLGKLNKWYALLLYIPVVYGGSYALSELMVEDPNWWSFPTVFIVGGIMVGGFVFVVDKFINS